MFSVVSLRWLSYTDFFYQIYVADIFDQESVWYHKKWTRSRTLQKVTIDSDVFEKASPRNIRIFKPFIHVMICCFSFGFNFWFCNASPASIIDTKFANILPICIFYFTLFSRNHSKFAAHNFQHILWRVYRVH
jgi:hypothetical protein